MRTMTPPKHTPWGASQSVRQLAEGIYFVSTASHGGVWLDPTRAALIPELVRRTRYSACPWFEEDLDCIIPQIIFFDALEAHADQTDTRSPEGRDRDWWIDQLRAAARIGTADQYWSQAQVDAILDAWFVQHQAEDPDCTCSDCQEAQSPTLRGGMRG